MISDFPAKYYELPEDPEVLEYIIAGPVKLYEYVKINESTNACEKRKTRASQQECYKLFLNSGY